MIAKQLSEAANARSSSEASPERPASRARHKSTSRLPDPARLDKPCNPAGAPGSGNSIVRRFNSLFARASSDGAAPNPARNDTPESTSTSTSVSGRNSLVVPADSPHTRSSAGSPTADAPELPHGSPNRSEAASPFNRLLRTRKTSKTGTPTGANCALTPIDEQHLFVCTELVQTQTPTQTEVATDAASPSPARHRLTNSLSLGERSGKTPVQPTRSQPVRQLTCTQTQTPGRTRRTGCHVPSPVTFYDDMDQRAADDSASSPATRMPFSASKKVSAPAMHPFAYERSFTDAARPTLAQTAAASTDCEPDDGARQQKKKSSENLIKTFKFLKRVSTDITIWKNKTGIKPPDNPASCSCSCNAEFAQDESPLPTNRTPDMHCAVHSARSSAAPLANMTAQVQSVCEQKSAATLSTVIPRYAKCLEQHRPTGSQIRAWGSSFQALLNHPCGLDLFREFLRSEFSDENIDFWIACEQYRQSAPENDDTLRQQARSLFDQFLLDQATKEVNLDSETRQMTTSRLEGGCIDLNTFAEAQQRIYTLMEKDSYRRFLRSDVYRYILQEYCDAASDTQNADNGVTG